MFTFLCQALYTQTYSCKSQPYFYIPVYPIISYCCILFLCGNITIHSKCTIFFFLPSKYLGEGLSPHPNPLRCVFESF